ncbi:MAG: hypothetical protein GF353_12885 [Candidatus Lokiarchaeota archaeon]|nr:hypothetical protein [Candidatus Lokiarchaeota archaeon]
MDLDTLKALLDVKRRASLHKKILNFLKDLNSLDFLEFQKFETNEGDLPVLSLRGENSNDSIKYAKIFVAAQHNEYNGLFSIIDFFKELLKGTLKPNEVILDDQILIFFPLMNPYGFIHPSEVNKSGYYLKNGSNLNRFWRRTFSPGYENIGNDLNQFPIPEHCKIVRSYLNEIWSDESIKLYFLDFHETSLLKKFPDLLNRKLEEKSISFKFDHWLKEGIIFNVIKLYEIPYYRKPLFFKCNPSANHTHLNLSIKQIDQVCEKLKEYIQKNEGKVPFYFCYSDKSKNYCERLASKVYENLKPILWETYFPAFDHHFHDHGCFVKMSDATSRPNVYSFELESQKQFFNLDDEIQKSENDPYYFDQKLAFINKSLKLSLESIKTMIPLF